MKIIQTKDYELVTKLNKPVHDLHVELYPEYFNPYNFETFKEFFKGLIDKEEFIFLLLEDDGLHVGFAMIEIRNYPETIFKKHYKSVYVHQLSISGEQRNKGYGSMLMEEITHVAKTNGINNIELDYWSQNKVAKNFYKKNSFTIHREMVYKDI